MTKRPYKVWMHLDVELMQRAIDHMRTLVPDRHDRARKQRAEADQLASDAEELRVALQESLKNDPHPPPRAPPKD